MDIGSFIKALQSIQRAHGDDLRIGIMVALDSRERIIEHIILDDAIPVVLDHVGAVAIMPERMTQEIECDDS